MGGVGGYPDDTADIVVCPIVSEYSEIGLCPRVNNRVTIGVHSQRWVGADSQQWVVVKDSNGEGVAGGVIGGEGVGWVLPLGCFSQCHHEVGVGLVYGVIAKLNSGGDVACATGEIGG